MFCSLDIDECQMALHECAENATCSDTEGSYECTCDPGFTGDGFNCTSMYIYTVRYIFISFVWHTETVIVSDVDECSSTEPPCDTHATCIDTTGSYICECVEGFSGNGTICEGGINMQ